jgi:hypothetical protein
VDVNTVDPNEIGNSLLIFVVRVAPTNPIFFMCVGKSKNPEEILNLVELVVGVAVMCESKAVFIRNIFLLNSDSQTVLKELVEHVLGRATDLEEDQSTDEVMAASGSEEELIRYASFISFSFSFSLLYLSFYFSIYFLSLATERRKCSSMFKTRDSVC